MFASVATVATYPEIIQIFKFSTLLKLSNDSKPYRTANPRDAMLVIKVKVSGLVRTLKSH